VSGAKQSWRDVLPVHPAADLFPLMPEPDLKALADDIKKNGLQASIVVLADRQRDGPSTYQLLDGRNRLDALELAGFDLIGSSPEGRDKSRWWFCGLDEYLGTADEDGSCLTPGTGGIRFDSCIDDPFAYVTSVNLHRRHLTVEQKRDLIAKLLAADPTKSDRQIAETVKASPTTVGKVRAEAEASGDTSTVQSGQLKRVGKDGKARKTPVKAAASAPQKKSKKPSQEDEMPTEEEAEESFQDTLYDHGRLIVDKEMSDATRQKFFAHLKRKYPAKPTAHSRDDVGPDSTGEIERKLARLEELEAENHRLRRENIALKSEVEELKAKLVETAI
jgi:ParB/Sulfiredoxin domain